MKKLLIAFCLLVLCACGKEKSVLLPEIQNTKITEITDVSPAYLFYDETKPDSLDLNKNNLIISTNWLVNVDKRLTLKQVIPSIIKLQEKKRNSDHKNKNARNYFTCNATSIKNLGFVDFTDVVYKTLEDAINEEINISENVNEIFVIVNGLNEIVVNYKITDSIIEINTLVNELKLQLDRIDLHNENHEDFISINLSFNKNLSFQDYISIKEQLINLELKNATVGNNEYIY